MFILVVELRLSLGWMIVVVIHETVSTAMGKVMITTWSVGSIEEEEHREDEDKETTEHHDSRPE